MNLSEYSSLLEDALICVPLYTYKNGVETFRGISRKESPDWTGWKVIRKLKKEKNFPCGISASNIDIHVNNHYYITYYLQKNITTVDALQEALAAS